MEQQYAVPSGLGTTYIVTDNPPTGATLVQGDQSPSSNSQPSLEQRIEVLEKAVSNINNRLGIKTDSDSVDLDAASKLLDSLDSSAATKATTEIADTNNGATVITAPTTPSSSGSLDPGVAAAIAKLTSSSISASAAAEPVAPSSSATAPIPSSDDIAKQLGDLT